MSDTLFPDLFTDPDPRPAAGAAVGGVPPRPSAAERRASREAELLADLNAPQREAVLHAGGPVLVVNRHTGLV